MSRLQALRATVRDPAFRTGVTDMMATCVGIAAWGLVTGVAMVARGTGYTSAPTIAFSGGTQLAAGTVPTGVGNATGFCVTSIAVTNAGSGYTVAPEVRIAPPISFGMKFYYNSQVGFYEPTLPFASQRPVGTIMPFIADIGNDVPVTLKTRTGWDRQNRNALRIARLAEELAGAPAKVSR